MVHYRYQVGGSLRRDDPNYVERAADDELDRALRQGDFCYVLNSRQMGKSSLLVRSKFRLEQRGYRCSTLDITGIGSETITPEQWYRGIITQIYLGLNLAGKLDLKQWWHQVSDLPLPQRLHHFLRELLTIHFPRESLLIFIDEIDSVLSLKFTIDDFFGLIRFCYNQRAIEPLYGRLNFALFGVTSPSELIRNKQRSPFNIGQAIALNGFTLDQISPLTEGLPIHEKESYQTLKAILDWTGGQPFLTHKLCHLVAQRLIQFSTTVDLSFVEMSFFPKLVANTVQKQILEHWQSQDDPEHLRTIEARILGNPRNASRLLGNYQLILLNESIPVDNSREQRDLLLSGLIIEDQGRLIVKNRIYHDIFNLDWVANHLAQMRPYAIYLDSWLTSSQQDSSALLTGLALKEALAWSEDKQLSDLDYRFLAASQAFDKKAIAKDLAQEKQEREKVEFALRSAQEANHLLAYSRKTAQQQMKKVKLRKFSLLSCIGAIWLILWGLRSLGLFQLPELTLLDRNFLLRPSLPIDPYITIIGIDEEDIEKIKVHPFSDRLLAQALQELKNHQPRLIGLDIYRDLAVEPGHEALVKIMETTPNLIGIEKLVGKQVSPPPTLAKSDQVGFNDLILDPDGKIRRAFLSFPHSLTDIRASFATKLALGYLSADKGEKIDTSFLSGNNQPIVWGKSVLRRLRPNDGGYIRAKTKGFQFLMNYRGDQSQFKSYSFDDLLHRRIPPDDIRDRVVLIGSTAPSLNDLFQTPYSPQQMAGVTLHANILSQLIHAALTGKGLLQTWSEPIAAVWLGSWIALGAILAWCVGSMPRVLLLVILSEGILYGISVKALAWGWWIPMVPCFLGFAIAALTIVFLTQREQEKLQLIQTVELILAESDNQVTTTNIAIEYLKQGETPEKVKVIENMVVSKLKQPDLLINSTQKD
jgi:CHASE2 domain-containing sensor protein